MTTYSQLMITAHKAESEIEEAQDKVRARSAMTMELVDSSTELSNQITRLMAALTGLSRATVLQVLPIAPGTGVMGEDGWIGILLPTQALTMTKLVWVRLPLPTAPLLAVAKALPPLEP